MKNPAFDTIIVGAGLAGACAALILSRRERVLVLEAAQPAAGASGVAAGLITPLTGLRAKGVWRIDEALEALHATLKEADATALFQDSDILRPAIDAEQAHFCRKAAQTHPHYATWLSAVAARAHFPGVVAYKGALLLCQGGVVHVPEVVNAWLAAARQRGAEVRTGARVIGWEEHAEGTFVYIEHDTVRHYARRVLLALGYGFRRHPELAALNLHALKGQTVRVARPDALPRHGLLPLSGQGYVVPEHDALVVGTSYEHDFTDLAPSDEQTRQILAKASRILPVLKKATVLDATAGVRVTVPGTRLPMLGPLPGRSRIWIFTALGSKGLLMAPLLARALPAFFEKPERIPPEVRVR